MEEVESQCSYIKVKGINTRYIKKGKGENVFILPGWRCDIERIYGLIDFFSDYFTVYCVDFPGHGKTEKLKGVHSLKKIAIFIKDWIESVKLENYSIFSVSMGAPIALHLISMLKNTNTINKLFFIAPWTNKETLKLNKLSIRLIGKTVKNATESSFLQKIGDKTFRSTRLLKLLISVAETGELFKGTDLTPFAKSWSRFSFKVCMETLSDTFDTDVNKIRFKLKEKKAYLIASPKDPYLHFDKTFFAYKRIFPQLRPIYLKQKFHAPRTEITKKFCQDNFDGLFYNFMVN